MKLRIYIAVSLLVLIANSVSACSWWWPKHSGEVVLYRIMPLDESEYEKEDATCPFWARDAILHQRVDYKEENVKLWQKQTSSGISLGDIEHVVYKAGVAGLQGIRRNMTLNSAKDNSFLKWIVSNGRTDILDFLILAKQSEQVRKSMNDPWYYDVADNSQNKSLAIVVEKCKQYKSGPLYSRYALQMVRALCGLRDYEGCVQYWEENKARLANDVVKKMTELKVASALSKTGRRNDALEIYAKYGDVASIRSINNGNIKNELGFVYDLDANSPYLEGELQNWLIYFGIFTDYRRLLEDEYYYTGARYFEDNSAKLIVERLDTLLKVAHKAVREKKSRKMAMWHYALAALYDAKDQPEKARKYLMAGMHYPKDAYLKDTYHFLRIYLDARTATYNDEYEQQLFKDLKWIAQKIKSKVTPEIYDKLRSAEGGSCYEDDNRDVYQIIANSFYWNDAMRRLLLKVVCPRMHKAGRYVREIQLANMADNFLIETNGYSGEMFAIVERLSYKATRDYYKRIRHPEGDFDQFLNSHGRTSRYYWYDILATKCLRERRYAKAVLYLQHVPLSYQKTMSVYPYMYRNPFSYEMETEKRDTSLYHNYKLHFAEQMSESERIMKHHHDPNERANAKIKYALGLRNSVHYCWFLTRYSSNTEYTDIRYALPEIAYPEDSAICRHDEYVLLSEKLIKSAFDLFTDREQAAAQLRKFSYYQRVMDDYGNTNVAQDIRLHCDKWRDYALNNKYK